MYLRRLCIYVDIDEKIDFNFKFYFDFSFVKCIEVNKEVRLFFEKII